MTDVRVAEEVNDDENDLCATAILYRALHAAGFDPVITESGGYATNVITVELPGMKSRYEIAVSRQFADVETNVAYELWARDHECSREGQVFGPLPPDHHAAALPCPLCGRRLGNGELVQLLFIGPEHEDHEAHVAGLLYTALALIVHAGCLQGKQPVGTSG